MGAFGNAQGSSFAAPRQLDETNQTTELVAECNKQFESILSLIENSKEAVQKDISVILTDHSKSLVEHIEAKVADAKVLSAHVDDRILHESTLLRNQSDAAAVLQEKKNVLQRQTVWIKEQMEATSAEIQTISAETIRWKDSADAAQKSMESTRKQSVKKAERLQQQLSLYASTTGIKWDYLEEEKLLESGQGSFLVGEVNVPSENTIRRITIDREKNSRYDIATQLWNVMDGSERDDMA